MALDATLLTEAIKAGLLSLPVLDDAEGRTFGDVMTSDQMSKMEDTISVYAEQIIDHIIANAVVTVNMQSHVHTGVTTGGGSSGPPVPTPEIGSIT
jgi:hypothetical protein